VIHKAAKIVDENEDASAEEMRDALFERVGVFVSPSSIGPALKRLGLRRKKKA
jgi:transposase